MRINATNNLNFRVLNEQIRNTEDKNVIIDNCLGQRFIGSGMGQRKLTINGTPGNALGAYLNGADIERAGRHRRHDEQRQHRDPRQLRRRNRIRHARR